MRPLQPAPACDFSANLRAERARAGLTQAELAERAGLNPASIGSYERGVTKPQIDTLCRIASALGVEPSLLLPSLEVSSAA
ncbi:MAG: helix-turn-helix transcriptional regulator [Phycisphaerales bacterium]|nr:helix-turn-helix transcriptional regulator [Phycisphaerales bacterium]